MLNLHAAFGCACLTKSIQLGSVTELATYLLDFAMSTSFLALVYSLGFAPKQTASSPSFTCRESASVSVKTTTVVMPRDLAERMTRRAISPLLAMSSFAVRPVPAKRQFGSLQILQRFAGNCALSFRMQASVHEHARV